MYLYENVCGSWQVLLTSRGLVFLKVWTPLVPFDRKPERTSLYQRPGYLIDFIDSGFDEVFKILKLIPVPNPILNVKLKGIPVHTGCKKCIVASGITHCTLDFSLFIIISYRKNKQINIRWHFTHFFFF